MLYRFTYQDGRVGYGMSTWGAMVDALGEQEACSLRRHAAPMWDGDEAEIEGIGGGFIGTIEKVR